MAKKVTKAVADDEWEMLVTVPNDLDISDVKKRVRSLGGKLDTDFLKLGSMSFTAIHAGGVSATLILKAATNEAAADQGRKIRASTGIRPGPL
jgi:hypothetical protein